MVRKLALCLCVSTALGCSLAPAQRASQTLYQRLGGEQGIAQIVNNFMYRVGDSELLRPLFTDTNLERFHTTLSEQLCEISGGPCRYSGDPMTEVHAGMAMNNRHFDAVVTALTDAMEEAGVGIEAQNAMLQKLAAMHGDVMREAVAP